MTNAVYEVAAPLRKNNKIAEVDVTIITTLYPPKQGYFVEVDIELTKPLKKRRAQRSRLPIKRRSRRGKSSIFYRVEYSQKER